jgi:hypothetical protein
MATHSSGPIGPYRRDPPTSRKWEDAKRKKAAVKEQTEEEKTAHDAQWKANQAQAAKNRAEIQAREDAERAKNPSIDLAAEQKRLQNDWGIPRPDDTAEQIVGRLIIEHSCSAALEGQPCRRCKPRIPLTDAEQKILLGTHKWVVFTRDGKPYTSSKAIVALVPTEERALIHFCFDLTKTMKPGPCHCSAYCTAPEAQAKVDAGLAYWMQVERDGQIYTRHDSIVLTSREVERIEQAVPRSRPILNFRNTLAEAVKAGCVDVALTDDEIWNGFKEPEKFCATYPALNLVLPDHVRAQSPYTLSERLLQGNAFYWDEKLKALGMPDTKDHGRETTGGYGSRQLDRVQAQAWSKEKGGRRVEPQGAGPDAYDYG